MTKDDFLALAPPIEAVEIPETGKTAHIRRMNNAERLHWLSFVGDDSAANMAQLLVRCICDEQGKRIFADNDVDAINNADGLAMEHLNHAALRINGMSSEAREEAKKN